MKLIVESGSTKTDWKLKNSEGIIKSASSMGINPTLQSSGEIKDEQDITLREFGKLQIKNVDYYGAGCGDAIAEEKIRSVLTPYFSEAVINVESDLIAAYKAIFGNGDGVICILGTGSNSALFENGKVKNGVMSLGYLMGDEGSGAQIGKVLMKDYFRNNIPIETKKMMKSYFNKPDDELIKNIYRLKYPNRFFARLVKDVISDNMETSYFNDLVEKEIHLFFHNCLLQYHDIRNHEIGFIGSIAYHFQEILVNIAAKYRLNIKNIIKQPIDYLVTLDN